jgi:1-acyl-sn-glycerol-3-phosphate acyltransferase
MQGWIRSVWRFFYFAFSTILGIAGFLWAVLWGAPKEEAGRSLRKGWLSHVPARLGLRMKVEGVPYHGTCLYVGNHITYIDPIVVLMHVDANVVAKAEIAKWPLVGLSANIVGTIFVKREEKSSREEAAKAISDALHHGKSILVFPEGTTSAGPGTIPFRRRSFDAAFIAGVPVQPIALWYENPKVAYIGDDTFLPHFFRLFRMKHLRGRVVFGPLLYGEDTCEKAKQWIDQEQAKSVLISATDELTPKT